MKFKDIELSSEQLKEMIETKASKFHREFIQNGIAFYRGGYEQHSDIRILATKKERVPLGGIAPRSISKTVNQIFESAGIASRTYNTLIGITGDPNKIKVLVDKEYYCIPLGDYNFSYLKEITADFNYMKDKGLIYGFESARHLALLGKNTKAMLENLLLSPHSEFDSNYGYLMDYLKMEADDPSSFYNTNDFEEDKERLYPRLQRVHHENIGDSFVNNDVSLLKGGAVSEVWFNYKRFLLIDPDKYNLKAMFSEYY